MLCGEPAPIKIAWTNNNLGWKFLGYKNYKTRSCGFFDWIDREKNHRERVYQLYSEKQMISRENQHLKTRISAMDKRYLELENANLLLEIDLKTEQHIL